MSPNSTTSPSAIKILAGMKPWHGGQRPPADWDGGVVRVRRGNLSHVGANVERWMHAAEPYERESDIIAYTPKTSPSAGTGDALREADWFKRNANRRNPEAFIRTNPSYFADECAAAILNGTLAALPQDRGGEEVRAHDLSAALRNTPAEALREAGYLDRAAAMLETIYPLIEPQGCPTPGACSALASPSRVGVPDEVDARAKALEEAVKGLIADNWDLTVNRFVFNGQAIKDEHENDRFVAVADLNKAWEQRRAILAAALAHTDPMQGEKA